MSPDLKQVLRESAFRLFWCAVAVLVGYGLISLCLIR